MTCHRPNVYARNSMPASAHAMTDDIEVYTWMSPVTLLTGVSLPQAAVSEVSCT